MTRVRSALLIATACALSAFAASACNPPPPPSNPTNTAVQPSASSSALGAPTCTGDMTWTYKLISADTGTGTTASVSHPRSYNQASSLGNCVYTDYLTGIHPGTWQITVLNLTCDAKLAASVGNHVVTMNSCQTL